MSAATAPLHAANRTIDWAHDVLGLSYEDIGRAVGAHRRSVARWRSYEHAPSRRHRREMEKLRRLRHRLDTAFEDSEADRGWLHSSVPALQGRTPMSRLEEGEVDEMIHVLAAAQSGAFV